jgi:hypothetical protein
MLPHRHIVVAVCLIAALVLVAVVAQGREYNYSAPTWADRTTGKATLGYCVQQPAPEDAEKQIEAALREWAKYAQLTFERGACYGDRTLTFAWVPADHGDWSLNATNPAHAHLPPPAVPEPLAGDVHFWAGREWTPEEIYRTALHEIGHSLGLWEAREGLMDSERNLLWLQQSDIDAIRRLYARRCFGVECAWGLNR